ncbi:MAG: Wadjet anti-phage system protein JetA family protein [Eubacterium sp.]
MLRQAFKTELVIRRKDLTAMLMDSLEDLFDEADFTEEAEEEGETDASALSAKAHLLFNRLKETGWVETEYEPRSFEENVTIPEYAISVINLLYDLSNEKVKEYNSYVYATYAALENAERTPDYVYQALQTAYQNTVQLVDELKALFNNIRRYFSRLPGENDVNALLHEHFDEYKEKVIDKVYFPLKTIDSVPRFKNPIMKILNGWLNDDGMIMKITQQGVQRKVLDDEEQGRDEVIRMIQYTVDTYEGIEEMIAQIDRKHNEYTNSSVERIRYLMNTDRSAKGKIIDLLKASGDPVLMKEMQKKMNVFSVKYAGQKSMYDRIKRTKKQEKNYHKLEKKEDRPQEFQGFLEDVRKQYSNKKIDGYMEKCMDGRGRITTEDIDILDSEDFILYLLCTIRGKERTAPFTTDFEEGNTNRQGYSVPRAVFKRKERMKS